MSPDLRVIVYPPDAQGGRRVRCDGEILGRALSPADYGGQAWTPTSSGWTIRC